MKTDLRDWDGKSTAFLRAVYAARFDWDIALALCAQDAVSVGASWLVKHHVERSALPTGSVQALLAAQRSAGPRDTLLHLIQALDKVDLGGCDLRHAAGTLRVTCDHDAPFVRAWSLSAFARLAAADAAYSAEARQRIEAALHAGAKPSVAARLKIAAKMLGQS